VAEGSPAELRSSIGGDVVVLETPDPASLAAGIGERFHLKFAAGPRGARGNRERPPLHRRSGGAFPGR